ncbi:MAG: bifunctional aldolase/short-chain dehydrogenase [Rhodobacteraceae bacterium]|nr:bifunctional aldolase/short-chain dehydrogenase [Paracoccaceae bacterium]
MRSLWVEKDATDMVANFASDGVPKDIALRIYTTRLLGGDARLVLHGGGNTSVKITLNDLLGEPTQVMCIKGSGWDMSVIEPAGLPAVRLVPLQKLRHRTHLDDADMITIQRTNLLDAAAPTPSVEMLLHAFLPHKFIDHTHASAILSLTDQADGAAICREVFGSRVGIVPYVFSGLDLAQKAAEVYRANPDAEGLILLKHGIFTFGDTARQAYERMIKLVSLAEAHIAASKPALFTPAALPARLAPLADILPVIRGACAEPDAKGDHARQICDFRTSARIMAFVNGAALTDYGQRGVVTPDNIIRIKNKPLIVPPPDADNPEGFAKAVAQTCDDYVAACHEYFADNHGNSAVPKTELDPMPRLVLIPGHGLVGLGETSQAAVIAADMGEEAINVITDAEAIGTFEALPEATLFEMEYWSLEQAKLGQTRQARLAGQVAVITGGGGAIGAACAELFAQNGAEVAILDLNGKAATKVATSISPTALGLECDVTDATSVRAAFDTICQTFGGVDIVISNAGAAWQGRIGELDDATLRKSFDLNFFSHQCIAQNAVRIMLAQKTGGVLLFNASKQAINPGANFGAYGLPKAATLFLSRQYALEYGQDGIRSNAVNADRIRSGLLSDDMIASRSQARGLSEADYLAGNLLKREVTAQDVAQAFLHQAVAMKTTADVTTVDGGNIAAILR